MKMKVPIHFLQTVQETPCDVMYVACACVLLAWSAAVPGPRSGFATLMGVDVAPRLRKAAHEPSVPGIAVVKTLCKDSTYTRPF